MFAVNIDYLTDTPTRLVSILNESIPGELDHDIAVGILSHMREIADGNIQDAADLCYVSTSTISRFIKKLRFENYNSFKYKLSSDLYFPRSLTSPIPTSEIDEGASPVEFYFQLLEQHIHALRQIASQPVLDQICDAIFAASNVVIFSHHDLDFSSFQVGMATNNKLIRHLSLDLHFTQMLPTFNRETLLLAPLYTTSNSMQKLALCKEREATIISISRDNKSLFNDLSDIALSIDTVSPEFNRYVLNFLFDTILINYRQKFAK